MVPSVQIGDKVYHELLYHGKEQMEVVGIRLSDKKNWNDVRKFEVELEGDYSGGTHCVCQRDWLPLEGLLLKSN